MDVNNTIFVTPSMLNIFFESSLSFSNIID